MTNTNTPGGLRRRVFPAALAGALAIASMTACKSDDILAVQDPDVAKPGNFTTPGALPSIFAGALGDFSVAYVGSSSAEGQINITGLFTDEFVQGETFPTRTEVELRGIQDVNSTMTAINRDVQKARASAEFAIRRFGKLAPTDTMRSEAFSLAGYTILMLAENYCSGSPLSTLNDDGSITYGDPLTTQQLFQTALARFDSATAVANAATGARAAKLTQLRNLAAIGRARALLGLGDFAGAATAAGTVPGDFVYNITTSTNSSRQNNGVWVFTASSKRWSVAEKKGINGLNFRSANDPRVTWTTPAGTAGKDFDNNTLYLQTKYPARDTPVALATGVEGQLIVAEGQYQAGNYAGALATLNALRATVSGLAPLTPAATPAAQIDQIFRERAFWLYLTAHRLSDMRRLVRQYGRDQATVFPTGNSARGVYGSDVNFPLPLDEANNPKAKGCLDRKA